jgi:hypothetical protein
MSRTTSTMLLPLQRGIITQCVCSAPLCMIFCQCHAVHGASQDGKLSLHYAAAKGVPLDVMKLLLDANLNSVTSKDKARS